jgi:hypothetical protein
VSNPLYEAAYGNLPSPRTAAIAAARGSRRTSSQREEEPNQDYNPVGSRVTTRKTAYQRNDPQGLPTSRQSQSAIESASNPNVFPTAEPTQEKPEDMSLAGKAGMMALNSVAAVGNALDLPGSMARDVLTWLPGGTTPRNPFDQLLDPFGRNFQENRVEGRQMLRDWGLADKKEDTWANFGAGLALEVATDPLTYLGSFGLTKIGQVFANMGVKKLRPLAKEMAELSGKAGKNPSWVGGQFAKASVTGNKVFEHVNKFTKSRVATRVGQFVDGKQVKSESASSAFKSIDEAPTTVAKSNEWALVDNDGTFAVYKKAKETDQWEVDAEGTRAAMNTLQGSVLKMTPAGMENKIKGIYQHLYGKTLSEEQLAEALAKDMAKPMRSLVSVGLPLSRPAYEKTLANPDTRWDDWMKKQPDAPERPTPPQPPTPPASQAGDTPSTPIDPQGPNKPQGPTPAAITPDAPQGPSIPGAQTGQPAPQPNPLLNKSTVKPPKTIKVDDAAAREALIKSGLSDTEVASIASSGPKALQGRLGAMGLIDAKGKLVQSNVGPEATRTLYEAIRTFGEPERIVKNFAILEAISRTWSAIHGNIDPDEYFRTLRVQSVDLADKGTLAQYRANLDTGERFILAASQEANAGSFFHEIGHDIEKMFEGTPYLQDMTDAINQRLGPDAPMFQPGSGKWNTQASEAFADGFQEFANREQAEPGFWEHVKNLLSNIAKSITGKSKEENKLRRFFENITKPQKAAADEATGGAGNPSKMNNWKREYQKSAEKYRKPRSENIPDPVSTNPDTIRTNPDIPQKQDTPQPAGEWVNYGDDSYGLKVQQETGSAEATLRFSGDESSIYVDAFGKNDNAPKGSGKALLNEIIEKSSQYNPTSISGHFTNQSALGALGSLLGKENITFSSRATGKALDISFAEAMKSPQNYIASAKLKNTTKAADAATETQTPLQSLRKAIKERYSNEANVDEIADNYEAIVRALADAADQKPDDYLRAEFSSTSYEDFLKTQEEGDLLQGILHQDEITSAEFTATESRIGGRTAYNAAKAAGKTNLNYRQWVEVRTPAFKKWFGDWENDPVNASKVVDPNTGEPLAVYHGTGFSDLGTQEAAAHNRKLEQYKADDQAWNSTYQKRKEQLRLDRNKADEAAEQDILAKVSELVENKYIADRIAGAIHVADNKQEAMRFWQNFPGTSRDAISHDAYIRLFDQHQDIKRLKLAIDEEIASIPPQPTYRGYLMPLSETPAFNTAAFGANDEGYIAAGSYFTKSSDLASEYAMFSVGDKRGVIPVYLNLKKPFIHGITNDPSIISKGLEELERLNRITRAAKADVDEYARNFAVARRRALEDAGYDGEIYDRSVAASAGKENKRLAESEIVAFEPSQIKSATANKGTFDATNPNILFQSEAEASPQQITAFRDKFGYHLDYLKKQGYLSSDEINFLEIAFKDAKHFHANAAVELNSSMEMAGWASAYPIMELDKYGRPMLGGQKIQLNPRSKRRAIVLMHELGHIAYYSMDSKMRHLSRSIISQFAQTGEGKKYFKDIYERLKRPDGTSAADYYSSSVDEMFAQLFADNLIHKTSFQNQGIADLIARMWEGISDIIAKVVGYDRSPRSMKIVSELMDFAAGFKQEDEFIEAIGTIEKQLPNSASQSSRDAAEIFFGSESHKAWLKSEWPMSQIQEWSSFDDKKIMRLINREIKGTPISQRKALLTLIKNNDTPFVTGWEIAHPELSQELYQRTGTKGKELVRGAVRFNEPDAFAKVFLFENANISTVAHELGHIARRRLRKDLQDLAEKIYKVKDGKWTREQEEAFARDFEKYLATGKAPTSDLTAIFAKMKQWISGIYKRIKNSPLSRDWSDEKQNLFDGMFTKKPEATTGNLLLDTARKNDPPKKFSDNAKHNTELNRLHQSIERTVNKDAADAMVPLIREFVKAGGNERVLLTTIESMSPEEAAGFASRIAGDANGAVNELLQIAYHGTPHVFAPEMLVRMPDGSERYLEAGEAIPEGAETLQNFPLGRFDLSRVSTGEGRGVEGAGQAHGFGGYSAQREGLGRRYKEALAGNGAPDTYKGKPISQAHYIIRAVAEDIRKQKSQSGLAEIVDRIKENILSRKRSSVDAIEIRALLDLKPIISAFEVDAKEYLKLVGVNNKEAVELIEKIARRHPPGIAAIPNDAVKLMDIVFDEIKPIVEVPKNQSDWREGAVSVEDAIKKLSNVFTNESIEIEIKKRKYLTRTIDRRKMITPEDLWALQQHVAARELLGRIEKYGRDLAEAKFQHNYGEALRTLDSLKDGDIQIGTQGALYKLEVPDNDDLMFWDKPFSEQPPKVQEGLKKLGISAETQWEETPHNHYNSRELRLERFDGHYVRKINQEWRDDSLDKYISREAIENGDLEVRKDGSGWYAVVMNGGRQGEVIVDAASSEDDLIKQLENLNGTQPNEWWFGTGEDPLSGVITKRGDKFHAEIFNIFDDDFDEYFQTKEEATEWIESIVKDKWYAHIPHENTPVSYANSLDEAKKILDEDYPYKGLKGQEIYEQLMQKARQEHASKSSNFSVKKAVEDQAGPLLKVYDSAPSLDDIKEMASEKVAGEYNVKLGYFISEQGQKSAAYYYGKTHEEILEQIVDDLASGDLKLRTKQEVIDSVEHAINDGNPYAAAFLLNDHGVPIDKAKSIVESISRGFELTDFQAKKAASKDLHSVGIKGNAVPENFLRGGNKQGYYNFVVFDDKDIKILDRLEQKGKGVVSFKETGEAAIKILTGEGDASTVIHELSHVFRRNLSEDLMSKADKAIGHQLKDADTLRNILGGIASAELKDANGNWTREAEEVWARLFEKYMLDGTAPTTALKEVFAVIKRMMRSVYKTLKVSPEINAKINDDLKQVFDEMLGKNKKPLSQNKNTLLDTAQGTPRRGQLGLFDGEDYATSNKPRNALEEAAAPVEPPALKPSPGQLELPLNPIDDRPADNILSRMAQRSQSSKRVITETPGTKSVDTRKPKKTQEPTTAIPKQMPVGPVELRKRKTAAEKATAEQVAEQAADPAKRTKRLKQILDPDEAEGIEIFEADQLPYLRDNMEQVRFDLANVSTPEQYQEFMTNLVKNINESIPDADIPEAIKLLQDLDQQFINKYIKVHGITETLSNKLGITGDKDFLGSLAGAVNEALQVTMKTKRPDKLAKKHAADKVSSIILNNLDTIRGAQKLEDVTELSDEAIDALKKADASITDTDIDIIKRYLKSPTETSKKAKAKISKAAAPVETVKEAAKEVKYQGGQAVRDMSLQDAKAVLEALDATPEQRGLEALKQQVQQLRDKGKSLKGDAAEDNTREIAELNERITQAQDLISQKSQAESELSSLQRKISLRKKKTGKNPTSAQKEELDSRSNGLNEYNKLIKKAIGPEPQKDNKKTLEELFLSMNKFRQVIAEENIDQATKDSLESLAQQARNEILKRMQISVRKAATSAAFNDASRASDFIDQPEVIKMIENHEFIDKNGQFRDIGHTLIKNRFLKNNKGPMVNVKISHTPDNLKYLSEQADRDEYQELLNKIEKDPDYTVNKFATDKGNRHIETIMQTIRDAARKDFAKGIETPGVDMISVSAVDETLEHSISARNLAEYMLGDEFQGSLSTNEKLVLDTLLNKKMLDDPNSALLNRSNSQDYEMALASAHLASKLFDKNRIGLEQFNAIWNKLIERATLGANGKMFIVNQTRSAAETQAAKISHKLARPIWNEIYEHVKGDSIITTVLQALDAGENLFYATPGAKMFLQLFDRSVMGAYDHDTQELARLRFQAFEQSIYEFRAMLYPISRYIGETQLFDLKAIATNLIDNAKLPREEALTKAKAIINARNNEIIRFFEAKPEKLYHLSPEVFKDTDIDLDKLETMLQSLKDAFPRMLDEQRKNGLSGSALFDTEVPYYPRNYTEPGKHLRSRTDGEALMSTKMDSQRQRDEAYRHIPGGRALINEMSLDPKLSGIAHKEEILKNKLSKETLTAARKHAIAKYGLHNILSSDPIHGFYKDGKLTKKGKAKVNRLITSIAKLPEDHITEGVPMFGHNFLRDFAAYAESHHTKNAVGLTVQDLVTRSATYKGEQKYLVSSLFQATALDNHNAYLNVLRGTDNFPGYKQFVDEKIKKLIKDKKLSVNRDANGKITGYTYKHTKKPQDFKTLDEFIEAKHLSKIYADKIKLSVPKEIHESATHFLRTWTTPPQISTLVQISGAALNTFKSLVTLPFPSFHSRNFISGMMQNVFYGAYDPTATIGGIYSPVLGHIKPLRQAVSISNGNVAKGISKEIPRFLWDDDLNIPDEMIGTPEGDELVTDWVRQGVFRFGLTGDKQGQAAEKIGDTVSSLVSQNPGAIKRNAENWYGLKPAIFDKTTSAKGKANPIGIQGSLTPSFQKAPGEGRRKLGLQRTEDTTFVAGRIGEEMSLFVENANRIMPYIAFLKQGVTPEEAAKRVNMIQFDYSNLSDFERRYMKQLIPFYTFTSKALKLTLGDLITNPAGKQAWVIRGTNRLQDREAAIPEHIRKGVAIPLPQGPGGEDRYLSGFGLAWEDPIELMSFMHGDVQGTASSLFSKLRPEAQGFAELAFGRSAFFGRDFRDMDPQLGRLRDNLIGQSGKGLSEPIAGSQSLEVLAGKLPTSRLVSSVNQAFDDRKSAVDKLLNLATGFKVNTVNEEAKNRIIMNRVNEEMKDLGAREMGITYVPEWQKQRMSEAERRRMELLQQMVNEIKKESRENKKKAQLENLKAAASTPSE